jgi:hypothetical protein
MARSTSPLTRSNTDTLRYYLARPVVGVVVLVAVIGAFAGV